MFKIPAIDYKDWIKSIIFAVIFATLFRTFLYEPYKIPSGSMYPTFKIGDFLFVSKYKYGYSNYTFFGIPFFEGRIMSHKPERGDVIVFKNPKTDEPWIKRLIGFPGDKVQVKKGVIYINNNPVSRVIVETKTFAHANGRKEILEEFEETLPNGVRYKVWNSNKPQHLFSASNTRVFTVPKGHYFFMGDNRDNSNDSRLHLGFVPEDRLLGRAEFLFWNSQSPIDEITKSKRLFSLFQYQDRIQ